MEIYADQVKGTQKVMSLPLLKILGNEMAKTTWDENSKQVVWSALTLAFFGSFRMGEILSQQENSFSPKDTLLWSNLKFLDQNHILVHVKTPKSRLPQGEFINIFTFEGHNVCPVRALMALRDTYPAADQDSPVFRFSNGSFLTKTRVNSMLPQLLSPHLGPVSCKISGHSFRAAIPAVLARHPDVANSSDIMGWGRWRSSAFLGYQIFKRKQRRWVFDVLSDILIRN